MLLEIPDVLTQDELAGLRIGLSGLAYSDGRLTAGDQAVRVKNNLEVQPSKEWEPLARMVMAGLMRNDTFIRFSLPRKLMNPLFNRYDEGMEYGSHTDIGIMDAGRPEYATRADLSMTLFISEPESYDGGELVISSSVGESAFKPAAGTLVIYPSGELHWVTKVTRGSRIAAVSWIQSYVKPAQRRTILFEMDSLSDLARARGADQEEIDLSVSVYHKLLRLWSET